MKILWIIPKWTFPAVDGARVATERLIRNTIIAGAQVDVLCLAQKDEIINIDEMKKNWNTDNIFVVPRIIPTGGIKKAIYYLKSILIKPFTPITFSSFTDKKLKEHINQKIKDTQYDIMLFDCLHLGAPFIENGELIKPTNVKKIIYRAHNLEADIWKKYVLEEKNILKKLILKYQSTLVTNWENTIAIASNGIAAIANEDLEDLKLISPNTKYKFIPLGLDFKSPLEYCDNNNTQLLFVGRLDWPPNKEGLKWILSSIWPEVLKSRKDIILNVVGSGNRDWLDAFKNLENVKFHGFVPDIKDMYKLCDFTIAPIKFGSGTRIKVIESYAFGRNIISTKMGAQGSGLTQLDYIHCETDQDWIEKFKSIKLNDEYKELSIKMNLKLGGIYDEAYVGLDFYSWLKTFL
jgi:glycosyltransferase involved in cell wall biosynthesis